MNKLTGRDTLLLCGSDTVVGDALPKRDAFMCCNACECVASQVTDGQVKRVTNFVSGSLETVALQ